MTAGELAVVLAAVLCCLGFAALIVVLVRVLDALTTLRGEVSSLRAETGPLLAELRASTASAEAAMHEARDDLDRFDQVIGSAEAISTRLQGTSRLTRAAFSTPVIKTVALASGTSRAARQLRAGNDAEGRRGRGGKDKARRGRGR